MKRILLLILLLAASDRFCQAQDLFHSKKKQEKADKQITLQRYKKAASRQVTSSVPDHQAVVQNRAFDQGRLLRQVRKPQPVIPPKHVQFLYAKGSGQLIGEGDARKYLDQVKSKLQVLDPEQEFQLNKITTDRQGFRHFKYDQYFQGYKVYASQVIVHENARGLHMLNGHYHRTPAELKEQRISLFQAEKVIAQELTGTDQLPMFAQSLPIPAHEPKPAELVIFHVDEEPYLAFHIEVRSALHENWEYFIDANDGTVLNKFNKVCYFNAVTSSGADLQGQTQDLNVVDDNGTLFMADISREMYDPVKTDEAGQLVGAIITLDAASDNDVVFSSNGNWSDASAVSAHVNAGIAYEYFRQTYNRNSINGSGGNVLSLVNVPDPETGAPMDNAFWDGQAIYYGNGDSFFSPLAGSLDVAGHEMSHGVVSNTADLIYQDQPGALNESFADIFGAMMDREDWLIGEDIVLNGTALRSMEDPSIGNQPAHMRDLFTGPEDNGGVHINSGIPNHAYYLFATTVGSDVAEQIFYRALDVYLTASSDFADFRIATLQAATDLHGASSSEVAALGNALDAVGIFGQAVPPEEEDLEVISGDNFILSLDTNPNDANTLYVSDTQGQNFVPLTTTAIGNKPSVTDNGQIAIYVGGDSQLFILDLEGSNGEELLDDQTVWGNVAISKDGNRIALNTNFADPSIYILDLESGEFRQFELYNPTFTEGVQAAGVRFADAMEWDYSGEFLVYDGFNTIEQEVGDNIDFWDVGFMRVWDNDRNSFGDGEIFKLFTNLPEGVSIGNPSFSKTSDNVLAFDYFDELSDEVFLLAANIETGDVSFLAENNVLGYPNYASDDSQIIFNTTDGGVDFISTLPLQADRINASGNPSRLIQFGRWGIWYAQGERALQSDQKEMVEFSFRSLAPEVIGTISGTSINLEVPFETNVTNLISNFVISAEAEAYIGSVRQVSGVTINDFTNPLTYTVQAEDGSEANYTVNVNRADQILSAEADPEHLVVYPNPASEVLFVRSEALIREIRVYGLDGKLIANKSMGTPAHELKLNVSKINPGTYLLELHSADGKARIRKWVRE